MNEVTRVLQELIEMYEGHPPLSRHQIPRGVKTLEERVEFEINGAFNTEDDDYKLSYYHNAVHSILQVIAVMEDKMEPEVYSTDPEINEFFTTKDHEALTTPPKAEPLPVISRNNTSHQNRRQLKYGEKVPERNEHTDKTDQIMQELDQSVKMPLSKNARKARS